MPPGTIRIGTSGWHYRQWSGPVYPAGLSAAGYLSYYAGWLETVELNNTFYRLPERSTFEGWRDNTPDGFLFACKASRYITHMKKLKDPAESLDRFLSAVAGLGDKLGPVLFQLPPRWRCNVERLADFLTALPSGLRAVFEFRDTTWHNVDVYALLRRHGAALCCFDLDGRQSPCLTTTGFAYVRLHGPGAAYQGQYGEAALRDWADRLCRWRADGLDVFCYFDNDEAGHAFHDALRLQALIGAEVPDNRQ